jgi:hypothetical protein
VGAWIRAPKRLSSTFARSDPREQRWIAISRLDVLDQELDELLAKAPRFWWLAALAPVVWYFAGGGWAFVELLVTASLVGTQVYLLRVRKSENRWNRDSLIEDVARLRRESAGQSNIVS